MRKRNNYKSKYLYRASLHIRAVNRNGGTIINIITAVIFFGLIAFGVMWVLKQTGEEVGEYTRGVVNTQKKATTLSCQINLRTIYQNLQIYGIENNEFPSSFKEIEDWSGDSKLFRCPDPNGQEYIYIPGQRLNSPPQNILVYEPEPVHNGGCNVLRVNGMIDLVSPEELQAALKETKAHLK